MKGYAVLHTHPQARLSTELTELGKLGTNRFFQVDQVKPSLANSVPLGTECFTRYHSVLPGTTRFYSVPLSTARFY